MFFSALYVLYCLVLLLFCRVGECSKGGGRCLEALRFASQELLARAKEAKELQDDICSNGTWHLSGDFKALKVVSFRLVFISFRLGRPAKSPDDNSAGH